MTLKRNYAISIVLTEEQITEIGMQLFTKITSSGTVLEDNCVQEKLVKKYTRRKARLGAHLYRYSELKNWIYASISASTIAVSRKQILAYIRKHYQYKGGKSTIFKPLAQLKKEHKIIHENKAYHLP